MKNRLFAGLLLALSLPVVMSAAQTLTFEGFADLTVLTNQYPGIDFQGATILTCGGALNCGSFPPRSGVNVVYNPVGPMELLFSTPIDFFEGYFTYNAGLTLQGYDVGNNLLATALGAFAQNFIGSGNPPNEKVRIDAVGITKVRVTGGGGNNFTMDDAAFTGSINVGVPEPSTFAMFGGALTGLAMYLRRRRVS